MGLTISYQIKLRAQDFTSRDARKAVEQSRAFALEFQRSGRIASVSAIRNDPASRAMYPVFNRRRNSEGEWSLEAVDPVEGWVFHAAIGEGCETLRLGLCRYPSRGSARGGAVWRLESFCKTQYANVHGWEHFRRCHLSVLELVAFWKTLGAKVVIRDEGEYWPRNSEDKLRRNLEIYDQCVAAVCGKLKDADKSGKGVASPILAHPHFELLEARGAARLDGIL